MILYNSDMKKSQYGEVILNFNDLFESLYSGSLSNLNNINIQGSEEIDKFNLAVRENFDNFQTLEVYKDKDITVEEFDQLNQKNWFMPDEYKNMDIEGYLVHVCPKENYQRLIDELQLFRQHQMIDVLRYLKYLVDTLRENKVVWGVGRGSSVASYALYLLGVHKIDSIKFKLDFNEFLK